MNFTVTDKPTITITLPENTTYFTTNLSLNFTATDSDGISACWYTNTTGSNVTLPGCENTTFIAAIGQHTVTVYANDTLGIEGSANVTFTVLEPLTVNISSPENTTYASSTINVTYNVSGGTTPYNCTLELDGVNLSYPSCSNTTLTYVHYADSTKVLAYDFAEQTGTALYDRSVSGKDGVLVNTPTWNASGRYGGALQFDAASSEYVTISDTTDPTAYTIAAWVYPTDNTSTSIFVRTSSSGPTSAWSHQLRITSDSKFQHYVYDGTAHSTTGTTSVAVNKWYFVVATAENNDYIRLYVNGVEEGTAQSINTLWTGGDRWYMGSNSGNSMGYYSGLIDELVVWNRSLNASEIASLYDESLALGSHNLTVTVTDTNSSTGSASVNFSIQAQSDSCTPPAAGNDWLVDASDFCVKTGEFINLGSGRLVVTGEGYLLLVNTTITARKVLVNTSDGLVTKIRLRGGSRLVIH